MNLTAFPSSVCGPFKKEKVELPGAGAQKRLVSVVPSAQPQVFICPL